ncbi:hypothetical protein [Thermoflexus sp.]|uniref:hypothetical protein n=1 Tax=Thermoflexus sp. TaxID=1969742 RepID=UPI0025EDB378|nr:hypothetical protein [Thermoflexus sp.]MDW8180467.1 hypothetical protein [Anaerolineae bacterium]MCS6963848.1 hypothetical protein [Thermoflexus sp.]MCS7351015.1 hypothetical protein [Thermoflexus sp.]MCX7691248.1 hypothetical protein [Thermoflexus sp.]MDW8184805.1 hypothetical protein [Anaerolineae bacterium]
MRRLIWILALLLSAGISSGKATAQRAADAVDMVILVDRSSIDPGPEVRARMQELISLWITAAGPRDRVGILRVGSAPRWLTSGLISRGEGRAAARQSLRRIGGFDGGEANWAGGVDQALRALGRLEDPAFYQALLALARRDPTSPVGQERLRSAAVRLQGPPVRPFYGLSLEGGLGRLDRFLSGASGGWAQTASLDWRMAGLRMATALSPHRWLAQTTLLPGADRSLILPPRTTWAAFVLFRPDRSARLAQLSHQGQDWMGPAAQPQTDRLTTDGLEVVTLLEPGDYGGEWRIRIEGTQEAELAILIGLRDPLGPAMPGSSRRWVLPTTGPLYVEAEVPALPTPARLSLVVGDEEIRMRDDGGSADRVAGDRRAGGLSEKASWEAEPVAGAFRLEWEGMKWEQPVWLEFLNDLPALTVQAPISPVVNVPLTITVERPAGVEEVIWRWAGWRIGGSDWQTPEHSKVTEVGWTWRLKAPNPGQARFLALAEIRITREGRSLVYPQAVVLDFPVASPFAGQVQVAPEALPTRLNLPGKFTLVITSTLDRPARLRVEVEDPQGSVQALPSAFQVPAREVIRQVIELRGGGEPQTIRLRLREEANAPVLGGEIELTVARARGGFPAAFLCLLPALAGAAFLVLRRVLAARSVERWG